MQEFNVIYADPPWPYNNPKGNDPAMGGITYPTMSLDDIKALPIGKITASDCSLFLWATMPKLEQAYTVIRAWGFKPITTTFVWVKTNPKSGGIYSGLGHWTNGNAELVLFGKRGRPKRVAKNVKQIVMAPRGKHSAKPNEVRERIVRLMGDVSRIELFARNKYPGWTCLGNEVQDGLDIRDALRDIIEAN